jgi:hypothetical protein
MNILWFNCYKSKLDLQIVFTTFVSLECSFKPLIKVWPAKYLCNDAKKHKPIYVCVCVWYRFYTRVVQDSPPGDLAWKIIQLEVSTYKHTQRNE